MRESIHEDPKFLAFIEAWWPEGRQIDAEEELVEVYGLWEFWAAFYEDPAKVQARVFRPKAVEKMHAAIEMKKDADRKVVRGATINNAGKVVRGATINKAGRVARGATINKAD